MDIGDKSTVTSGLLYDALVSRLEAQKQEAKATLAVYFDNAAGIGEHPQIVEEMAKQVERLASAEDSLMALTANFKNSNDA